MLCKILGEGNVFRDNIVLEWGNLSREMCYFYVAVCSMC